MYCQKCGTQNEEGTAFCTQCGAPLAGEGGPQAHTEGRSEGWGGYAGGISPEEERLISEKVEYYAPRFSHLRTTGGQVSWNWCAFFVFPAWAIYRKMYKECVLYMVATELLSLALFETHLFDFVICVAVGMLGNWLYLRNVSGHAVAMASMPDLQREAYAAKFGGVSSKNVGLFILASFVWHTVLNFFGI